MTASHVWRVEGHWAARWLFLDQRLFRKGTGNGEGVMSSKDVETIEDLNVVNLRVGKHFKMQNGNGTLVINSSNGVIGVWLVGGGSHHGQIGMCLQSTAMPYFMVYPKKGYKTGTGPDLPFALSAEGLQVPHPDGSLSMISLEEISAIVKAYKK